MNKYKGIHLIADLVELPDFALKDPEVWIEGFTKVIKNLDIRLIKKESYVFSPPYELGFTAFILLDSSHFSIHAYAREKIAAIDIFICKKVDITSVLIKLLNAMNLSESNIGASQLVKRFITNGEKNEQ